MDSIYQKKRIWEIDFFRGIALIFMVYYHILYDLRNFYNFDIDYSGGINFLVTHISATPFILLAGLSCTLSRSNIRRGLKVLAVAFLLTVMTFFMDPSLLIKFGILHLLGVCMLLYPLFNRLNKYVLILTGIIIIILGNIANGISVEFDWLFPLGIKSNTFTSSDYYPLLPWLGVFVFGIALGKIFYSKKKSLIRKDLKDNLINMAGRNTLLLYLIHQPLIIGVLALLSLLKII